MALLLETISVQMNSIEKNRMQKMAHMEDERCARIQNEKSDNKLLFDQIESQRELVSGSWVRFQSNYLLISFLSQSIFTFYSVRFSVCQIYLHKSPH